jgi:enolase
MKSGSIADIKARQILNGRGIPAVEAEVWTRGGFCGVASCPSGVSTSAFEALDLRDGGAPFMGKGVGQAVQNIREVVAPRLKGMDVTDQQEIDQTLIRLDGTSNKSRLGGNAVTAISLAAAKAAASLQGIPLYQSIAGSKPTKLPGLILNMLSGSRTAGNELDFEDYLIVPFGFDSLPEALRAGVEVFHILHRMLQDRFGPIPQVTALAPPLRSTPEALDYLLEAIRQGGYEGRISLGIDAAASLFYDPQRGTYRLRQGELTREEMILHYEMLAKKYPILFLEDGLQEEDFEGFGELTRKLHGLVVGDDLFATNKERLLQGAQHHAANALLFKINQVGTLSEALETAATAKNHGYAIVSSVRSGETEDSAQADLAVAVAAQFMKLGAPIRGEMVTKYNRFLRIAEELGEKTGYRGKEF